MEQLTTNTGSGKVIHYTSGGTGEQLQFKIHHVGQLKTIVRGGTSSGGHIVDLKQQFTIS